MKETPAILALLAAIFLFGGCAQQNNPPQTDSLADYLNETAAVIGAGDTYDSVAYICGQPMDIRLMRVISPRGYVLDYPFEYFEYHADETSGSGRDVYLWCADDMDASVHYVEISRLPNSMEDTACMLRTELEGIFGSVGQAAVELNGCTAQLLCCTEPTGSALPSDAQLDCYVVHADDGCRVVTVSYTLSHVDEVYPLMVAALDTFTPSVG